MKIETNCEDALQNLNNELWGQIATILAYWQAASDECQCSSPHPIGACLKCDMEKLEDLTSEIYSIASTLGGLKPQNK